MSLIDRLLQEEIVVHVWDQLTRMSSESRLKQLISLQPINLYNTTTSFEVDGAIIEVEIESFLENVITKRLENASKLVMLGKWAMNENSLYNFHVIISAKMNYKNAGLYFKHHFTGKDYLFSDNDYQLHIENIVLRQNGNFIEAELEMHGYARHKLFTKKGKGKLIVKAKPIYKNAQYLLCTKELDYHIESNDTILKLISWRWHADIRKLLEEFLQYSIEEDLFNGRVLAQEEMNNHQKQPNFFVNGMLTSLELERISYNSEGIQAVLLSKGKIELRR